LRETSGGRIGSVLLSISFHHSSPCSYFTWGWTIVPLVAAVQRRSLTPSTFYSSRIYYKYVIKNLDVKFIGKIRFQNWDRSAAEEIFNLLWNQKVHAVFTTDCYCFPVSLSLILILSTHIYACVFKLVSPLQVLLLVFYQFLASLLRATCPSQPHSAHFLRLHNSSS
jgi:hypothetical protein